MKFLKVLFTFVIVLVCSSNLVYAFNTSVDYTQVIQRSIEQSPQYKYIGYQLSSRQMDPAIKLGALLPSIDIGGTLAANNLASTGARSDFIVNTGPFNSIQGIVSLTQPLYNYGAYKDLQSAEEGAEFAQQDYRTNYQQFLYDVSYAYFNLARAVKNVEYTSFNKKAAEANLKELKNQYEAGVADTVDYETSKSNYHIAVADYVSAQRDEKVARAELHKFTDRDDNIILYSNDFEVKDPNPKSEEYWEELAMRSNPAYMGSIHKKDSKYYDYQSATSPFMPKVNFEVKYSPGFNARTPLGNPVLDQFLPAKGVVSGFYFGISLEWNILSGGTDYAELKKAAYDYQSSEFDMIQTGRIARNDSMYAYRWLEYKKDEINALRKSAAAAKIAYEKYRDKYEAGTTTITQYFILMNQYYQYLIDLNNAESDYILGFLSLYKTAGILTTQVVEDFNNWILFNQPVEL